MKLLKKMILFLVIAAIVLTILIFLFMQQDVFGKHPAGKRKERVEKSAQYKDGEFKNIEETPMLAEGVSYVGMTWDFLFKEGARQPKDTLPSVKTDLKSLPDKPMLIWFGHSSYLIHLDGKNILVDPVFSNSPSPVQGMGSSSFPGTNVYKPEDFPPLDAIIISHDHYDHLDYNSITQLKNITRDFYVPLGVGEHLELWGVDTAAIHEMDWWESTQILDGMELVSTPARHFSGRGFVRNKTLWSSYVLVSKHHRLFIGGDSGYDTSFKKIGDQYGPFDLVILETGQYDKQWPNVHMMPEESVQASIDLKGKVYMPVHWGRFTLALHPWNDPIARASIEAGNKHVPIITPVVGEPVLIDHLQTTRPWWKDYH